MRTHVDGCIAPSHPALAGHFPGYPVVPGVVLLTEVLQAIERSMEQPLRHVHLQSVKFTAPLYPGEPFTMILEPSPSRQLSFSVTRGAARIASGTFAPAPDVAATDVP